MLCPNCETENTDDARFCSECGFPLSGAITRGAGAASPARTRPSYEHPVEDPFDLSTRNSAPQNAPMGTFARTSNRYSDRYQNQHGATSIAAEIERQSPAFSWEKQPEPEPEQPDFIEEPPEQPFAAAPQSGFGARDGFRQFNGYTAPLETIDENGYFTQQEHAGTTAQIDSIHAEEERFFQASREPDDYPRDTMPLDQTAGAQSYATQSYDAQHYGGQSYDAQPYTDQPYDAQPYNDQPYEPQGYDTTQREDYVRRYEVPPMPEGYEQPPMPAGYGQTANRDAYDEPYEQTDAYFEETYVAPETTVQTMPFQRDGYESSRQNTGSMPPARAFRAPRSNKRFSGKQIALIIGGIVVVLAALVAVVGFALGIWGGVVVPNVVGMTQEEAQTVLSEDGFIPKVLQVKSDEIEGRVLVMDPGAGSFAEEGSEVVIHVATARTIPEVVGEELDTALSMLADAGYNNVKQTIEYTDKEEGLVLSVTPEAGTRAKSSIEVSITVSENYKVPDISGMSEAEAKETLSNAGLDPYILYVDTDQYPDGTVMGTDPAAGTKVSEGAAVAITIARVRGVELVGLAEETLSVGSTVNIGDVSYQVESVESISYQGNDTVAFSITAKPFVTFFGETLFASSSQTVTGQIVYNSDNEVVSIS